MINLKRLGHVFVVVRDIARSKQFYTEILGFKVLEEDPEHGGVFMAIGDLSHTFDLVQSAEPNASGPPQGRPAKGLGVQHMAFLVESRDELKDAYFFLKDHDVPILAAIDHGNQESVYFHDPDQNVLEIYWERPNARAMFVAGRGDRDDVPVVFER